MAAKPIEQQVAELTPQQRMSLGKIFKWYLVTLILLVAIGVSLVVGLYVYYDSAADAAELKHDAVQLHIALNEGLGEFDLSLYDKSQQYLDEYFDMEQMKSSALLIGSGFSFVGVLVLYLVVKLKYPYFSEQKYFYVRKMEKQQNQ